MISFYKRHSFKKDSLALLIKTHPVQNIKNIRNYDKKNNH